jgi:hypothetical protein
MVNANRSRFRKRRVTEQLTDLVPAIGSGAAQTSDRSVHVTGACAVPRPGG